MFRSVRRWLTLHFVAPWLMPIKVLVATGLYLYCFVEARKYGPDSKLYRFSDKLDDSAWRNGDAMAEARVYQKWAFVALIYGLWWLGRLLLAAE